MVAYVKCKQPLGVDNARGVIQQVLDGYYRNVSQSPKQREQQATAFISALTNIDSPTNSIPQFLVLDK